MACNYCYQDHAIQRIVVGLYERTTTRTDMAKQSLQLSAHLPLDITPIERGKALSLWPAIFTPVYQYCATHAEIPKGMGPQQVQRQILEIAAATTGMAAIQAAKEWIASMQTETREHEQRPIPITLNPTFNITVQMPKQDAPIKVATPNKKITVTKRLQSGELVGTIENLA